MRHIKFILVSSMLDRWENGKISDIDFLIAIVRIIGDYKMSDYLRTID